MGCCVVTAEVSHQKRDVHIIEEEARHHRNRFVLCKALDVGPIRINIFEPSEIVVLEALPHRIEMLDERIGCLEEGSFVALREVS